MKVSTSGYLGGGIVCHECAEAKRDGDTDTLGQRIERYGGGEEWEATTNIQELLY